MKTRPIIFSGGMVRAILDGRKTQTRRVIKASYPFRPRHAGVDFPCPYGVPGDRLWVRETWGANSVHDGASPSGMHPGAAIWYRENWGQNKPGTLTRWRPSIHMPKVFSRITLEVVNVRVERVRDISERDARAEGCEPFIDTTPLGEHAILYQDGFAVLWDSINGKKPGRSWADNPWVWVVEFRVVS